MKKNKSEKIVKPKKKKVDSGSSFLEDGSVIFGLKEVLAYIQQRQSSVEIKRNSKGNVELMVKVYDVDPVKASERAHKVYEKLINKYKFGT